MTPNKIERLDKWLLWAVCIAIIGDIAVNYITSYGHLYVEGLNYGEYGVDARLNPIGIDLTLTALAVANVFAARFNRHHWLLRVGLIVGVGGTVAANAAYGASWGMTGGLLAVWSPVALFITVESGLFMFRIVADVAKEAAKAAQEVQEQTKRGRPVGSRNKPKEAATVAPDPVPEPISAPAMIPTPKAVEPAPANPVPDTLKTPAFQPPLAPVIHGHIGSDKGYDLHDTGQFPALRG